MADADKLPLSQQLILDLLAARHRLGEQVWTFPTNTSPALRSLEARGLIHVMHGIVDRTRRARLTEAGKALALDERYRPPNGGIERYRQALHDIQAFAQARSERPGMDEIAELARQALEGGPQ